MQTLGAFLACEAGVEQVFFFSFFFFFTFDLLEENACFWQTLVFQCSLCNFLMLFSVVIFDQCTLCIPRPNPSTFFLKFSVKHSKKEITNVPS